MRTIKLAIVAGMVASTLHFADNTFAIDRYPEPGWITPAGVLAAWFVVIAVAAVALARKTADGVFVASSSAYALVLLSGLLHYAFGPPMHMPIRSNVTVLAEAAAGVALIVALVSGRASVRS